MARYIGFVIALFGVVQIAAARGVDSDGDGVDDSVDVCCQTPFGVPVDSEGRPIGDLNKDCDVDIADYALLQNSLRGPRPQNCCDDSDCDDHNDCTVDTCDLANGCVHTQRATRGPLQSSPIAVSCDGSLLINVNPENNSISVFDATQSMPVKLGEISVGRDPRSVAVLGRTAYIANSFDGTMSVVDLNSFAVVNTINVGVEPLAIAPSANGTWVYVANSASNNMITVNVETGVIVHTTDLSPFGTAPRAIAVTNDGDTDDTNETIFVAMFYGALRPGKTSVNEGQDDEREGRVVAISGATLSPLGTPNPITLSPLANTGFNSNGQLAPAPGQVPAVASTNPQTFTTPTGAFPNQLAAIALHPTSGRGYVVSTAASPNGPLRFNSMNQGFVSTFGISSRNEVTAAQTDPNVRRTAPLNLDQGINLATTPAPRLFMANPVAISWRPDGSDAWIVIQNSDVIVRATVDANGIPTVGAPLVAGPSSIVRLDLRSQSGLATESEVPQGIVIDPAGARAFVSNRISRSVTAIDISNATAPSILGTVPSSTLPAGGTLDAVAHLGASLFYTGRGPQGRMSQESWGGCIMCHPNGRSDNVTWIFEAGPRQTIPLDGMFDKNNPLDQRILNWSAVRDENHDFELNTRGVFGGRGLIDDDRLFFAIGGTSGATPTDTDDIEQFQQVTGAVGTTNDLASGAALPTVIFARRDFATATLPDGRVFIIGGRGGAGVGTLTPAIYSTVEFNPRANTLTLKNSSGFTRRHSLGAVAVRTSEGERIYAVGGYNSTLGSSLPVSTVEEYNPSTDTWRTVASLPTGVAQFGVTVAGGVNTAEPLQLIHVVSGNTGSVDTPSVANANPVQRFQADPAGLGTWSGFNPSGLTLRRNHGAATALRGVSSRIFVLGGQDAAGNVLDTVEEYLAQAVTVAATPHTSIPSQRAQFAVGSSLSTNQIYVVGGIDQNGTDQSTILEYSIATNGPVAGPAGTPSGAWVTRGNLSSSRRGLQLNTPPGVTNFLPVQSAGRDARQDAIAVWLARNVRTGRAPVSANDSSAQAGRTLFGTVALVVPSFSCSTCHGGAKWTRSTVDYTAPPSPEVGIGLGNERIIGAELRQTGTQGSNVLINVGTFTLGGGRVNEVRFNGADISNAINPLGANGFNIPSLLSVNETAPYFYSGLAQTLEEVLNGSQDGNGGTRHHFVTNSADRAKLIAFLQSIDETTPTFP